MLSNRGLSIYNNLMGKTDLTQRMTPCIYCFTECCKEQGARRAKDRDPGLIGGGRKSGMAPLRMQQVSLDLRNEYKRVAWGHGFGSSTCKGPEERRSSEHPQNLRKTRMAESKAEAGEMGKGRFFIAQVTHSGF